MSWESTSLVMTSSSKGQKELLLGETREIPMGDSMQIVILKHAITALPTPYHERAGTYLYSFSL